MTVERADDRAEALSGAPVVASPAGKMARKMTTPPVVVHGRVQENTTPFKATCLRYPVTS